MCPFSASLFFYCFDLLNSLDLEMYQSFVDTSEQKSISRPPPLPSPPSLEHPTWTGFHVLASICIVILLAIPLLLQPVSIYPTLTYTKEGFIQSPYSALWLDRVQVVNPHHCVVALDDITNWTTVLETNHCVQSVDRTNASQVHHFPGTVDLHLIMSSPRVGIEFGWSVNASAVFQMPFRNWSTLVVDISGSDLYWSWRGELDNLTANWTWSVQTSQVCAVEWRQIAFGFSRPQFALSRNASDDACLLPFNTTVVFYPVVTLIVTVCTALVLAILVCFVCCVRFWQQHNPGCSSPESPRMRGVTLRQLEMTLR